MPLGAVALAALAAYANALGNPFVFDDQGTVVDNPTIRSIAGSLAGGPMQSATAGRPLVNLSFALNYAGAGTSPWVYHAWNLAVLVLCAGLLFGLVRRTLQLPDLPPALRERARGVATAVAVLWAVHPLHSETINYVTQRSESMMALAYLATLYAALRAFTNARPGRWLAASIAACAAGMACKESMATAPLVVLLYDATFISGGLGPALRRRPAFYGALAATWLVLGALVVGGPRSHSAGFSSGVSPWTYLLNQGPMIVRYLRVALVPVGLVLDYGEPRALTLGAVWPAALVVLALLVAALAAWLRWPRAAFPATTFFILLAPTSSFVPIATEVGAERRMFLPLAALLVLGCVGAARLLARAAAARQPRVGLAAAAAVAVLFVALTAQRNTEYATAISIWQTVVDRWETGRAHYNLGIELRAAGRRADAIAAFERALADTPDAHYALGFERQNDQRFDEAAEHYRTYIRLRPMDANVVRAYHQLGRTLLAQGRHEEALTAFRDVLARKPGDVDGLAGSADTLLALKRWPEAISAYQQYLAVNPGNAMARFNLGLALFEGNRYEEAASAFMAVISREPSNVAAHVNLANTFGSMGRYGEAVQAFRRAAELETDPEAKENILAVVRDLIGH
jgi:tetratricopeptide (TPR) repeat protein